MKKFLLSIFCISLLIPFFTVNVFAKNNIPYNLMYEFFNEQQKDNSYIYTAAVKGIEVENSYDFYDIKIPDTVEKDGVSYIVTSIADNTFSSSTLKNKAHISSITLGKNVNTIGQSAFEGNTDLLGLYHTDSIEEIKSFAFKNCTSLQNIKFSNSLKTVGTSAFEGCLQMRLLDLSPCNSLSVIENAAFKNCSKIEVITIPENVNYIGASAFDIENLKIVNYNAIKAIQCEDVFNKNSSFYINFGKNVVSIPQNFLHKINRVLYNRQIVLPLSIQYIGVGSFSPYYNVKFYVPEESGIKFTQALGSGNSETIYYNSSTDLPEAYSYTLPSIREPVKEVSFAEKEQWENEYYKEEREKIEGNNEVNSEIYTNKNETSKLQNQKEENLNNGKEMSTQALLSKTDTSEIIKVCIIIAMVLILVIIIGGIGFYLYKNGYI